jgi:hypothetical protein
MFTVFLLFVYRPLAITLFNHITFLVSSHQELLAIKFSRRSAADLARNSAWKSSAEFFSAKLVSFPRAVPAQKKTPSEEGASWLGLVILVYPFYDFFHGVRATRYR